MPTSEAAAPLPTVWRNAGRHLWLGGSGELHAAVIEKDGWYAAIDAMGRLRGIFATLWRAQVALTPLDPDPTGRYPSR